MSKMQVKFQSINNNSSVYLFYTQGTTEINKGLEQFYIIDGNDSLEITKNEFLKLIKTKFSKLEDFNNYITNTFYKKETTANLMSFLKPLVTWLVDNYETSNLYTKDDIIENSIVKRYVDSLI